MLIYPLHIAVSAEEPEDKKLFWMHSNPLNGDYRIEWYSADGWRPIWVGSGGDVEEAPMDQSQYTRGQGMWNKLDLSGITDSISLLQQQINILQQDLQNEIQRSIGVEGTLFDYVNDLDIRLSDETARAIAASQANTDRIDGIDTKLNDSFVIGVTYNPTNTGVERVTTRKNIYTGTENTTSEAMPIVSNTAAGIVLPDLFNTVNNNTDRISTLEQAPSGSRRLGIFDNKTTKEQTTNTTLDEFVIPADAKEHDTAIVRRDETHQFYKTEYELNASLQWVYLFVIDSTPPIATNTTVGVVKGDTLDGKVAVETDGSMSVVGWDGLKNSIPTNVSELVNDAGYITVTDIGIDLPDATSTVKGVTTLGSTGGAARYGLKEDVGLSNVDNTTDLNKPISNLTQNALDNKLDKSNYSRMVYGVSVDGNQTMIPYTYVIQEASIVQRYSGGDIIVRSSVTGDNAIGAAQVDSKILTAVSTKANDNEVVKLSGNQTIAGVKTFNSSPIIPTPTTGTQAANKDYVDSKSSDTTKWDYYEGYNSVTSLSSLPITKQSIRCTLSGTTASYTLSTGTIPSGKELHIKVRNTGTVEKIINLPNNTTYESIDNKGTAITSVKIPAGGNLEINIWALDKRIIKTDA